MGLASERRLYIVTSSLIVWAPAQNDPWYVAVNILRPEQNGHHSADDILKCIFLNENVCILMKISLEFVPIGPTDSKSALVQVMSLYVGDKLLTKPMLN